MHLLADDLFLFAQAGVGDVVRIELFGRLLGALADHDLFDGGGHSLEKGQFFIAASHANGHLYIFDTEGLLIGYS